MRPDFIRSVRVGSVILIAGFVAAAVRPYDSHASREITRLRAHFDSVDAELRARDVSTLTFTQRERRSLLVRRLREYRDAGTFPVNDGFAGRLVPIFRDSRGVLCAMAYLIDRSGRGDIVDKVARTRNNAYIAQLADDPVVIAWLDENGLSVAEAARIQPSYVDPNDRVDAGFALRTVVLGGGSLASAIVNIVKPTLAGEIVGVLVGTAAIVNGLAESDGNEGTNRVANASKLTGAIAVATGVGAFLWPRIKSRDPENGSKQSAQKISVAPSIVPASSSYRFGILASARF